MGSERWIQCVDMHIRNSRQDSSLQPSLRFSHHNPYFRYELRKQFNLLPSAGGFR